MHIRLDRVSGCTIALLVFFVPAIFIAWLRQSPSWLIAMPAGIVILALVVAAIPSKRKVTPEQFANELERHLLGTEGPWDWDDVTSIAIADDRRERIRRELSKFDSLSTEKNRKALEALVAAIRRGELPELVATKFSTYGDR